MTSSSDPTSFRAAAYLGFSNSGDYLSIPPFVGKSWKVSPTEVEDAPAVARHDDNIFGRSHHTKHVFEMEPMFVLPCPKVLLMVDHFSNDKGLYARIHACLLVGHKWHACFCIQAVNFVSTGGSPPEFDCAATTKYCKHRSLAAAMLTLFLGTPHAVNQLLRLCGADNNRSNAHRLESLMSRQLQLVKDNINGLYDRYGLYGRYGRSVIRDWVLDDWFDLMSGDHHVALRCAASATCMQWRNSYINGGRAALNDTVHVVGGPYVVPFNDPDPSSFYSAQVGDEWNDLHRFCRYIVDNHLLRHFCLNGHMGPLNVAATTAIIDVIHATISTW